MSAERYGLARFEKGENRLLAPRVNYSGVELELSFGGWREPSNGLWEPS